MDVKRRHLGVNTTPRFEGRRFGTNVIEATLTAVASKGRSLTSKEIQEQMEHNWAFDPRSRG